jgi:hypothetical protein
MYIISKFKDYYDGVAGTMGIDKTIVYERHTIEITKNNEMLKEFHYGNNRGLRNNPFINLGHSTIDRKKNKRYVGCSSFIIGFCGKLYLGWKLFYNKEIINESGYNFNQELFDIVYEFDNIKEFIVDHYYKSDLNSDINYIMSYDCINMFREINSPIFVIDFNRESYYLHRSNITQINNPILKEYEFYRIFDAFQAFQEIQMFIGGVLGSSEKNIIEIDDKYKIAKFGFDKWSFRKEPKNK